MQKKKKKANKRKRTLGSMRRKQNVAKCMDFHVTEISDNSEDKEEIDSQ